jgi:tetratricopeptide (TPR) repeat protein
MTALTLCRRAGALACAFALASLMGPLSAGAQSPAPVKQANKQAKPVAAAATSGYRVGKAPAWVRPAKPSATAATPASGGLGYRFLLIDTQTLLGADATEQVYTRTRTTATEAAGLQVVSKAELYFNPAFQTLTLHEAAVVRNGTRSDRLKDARIEMLRREEGLERQTLTGLKTLLVVLNDVRVGDVVEVAYTVQGANPIYKGHYAETFQLAYMATVDELNLRIDYPRGRVLHTRGIRSDAAPEIAAEGNRQVMQLTRRNVPAVVPEENVPPWFKVFPAVHVSDYADWQNVATWADELFANPGELGPELSARIEAWRNKGLTREELASEVVEFVQDEVRYFSVSLGESSHRPKAPAKTHAERLGDCKDKVALLNAILRRLGFDAKPALISVARNRGVADYLPSHDQFDHVITQLTLNDTVYWIDATLQKQGRKLANRGFVAYGMGLVVDPRSTELTPLAPAPGQLQGVEYDSVWDASDMKRAPQFTSILRARGIAAEGWRSAVSAGGTERIASAIAGAYARVLPGLKSTGAPVVRDDRDLNLFELELKYEATGLGQYDRGALAIEVPALELLDSLVGPREVRREMPYLVDQPRQVRQRVRLVAPRKFSSKPPAPAEVGDKHFNLATRYEVDGNSLSYVLTYERRSHEVLPADLASYRERVQAARKLGGVSARLPLLDFDSLRGAFGEIDRRVQRTLGQQTDTLREIVTRQEVDRLLATETLLRAGPDSPLAAAALERRAIANSMLADFKATLADADGALAAAPEGGYSHYTRGLALLSLGRADEAVAALQQVKNPGSRALLERGIGGAQYYQGQYAQAEQTFRQSAQESSGEDRVFALNWLYLAAERKGGAGKAALDPYLGEVDKGAWPGVLVHYLAGNASQDDVIKLARQDKRMERLNLAEAYFYLGQRMLLTGKTDDARRMFQRTLDTRATPYREHALAEVELKRAAAAQ